MVADPADPVVTSSRSEERDARTPEWREMAGNLPLSRRETIYAGWCEACGVEADPVYRICEACREKYLCVEPAPSPADQGLRAALLTLVDAQQQQRYVPHHVRLSLVNPMRGCTCRLAERLLARHLGQEEPK